MKAAASAVKLSANSPVLTGKFQGSRFSSESPAVTLDAFQCCAAVVERLGAAAKQFLTGKSPRVRFEGAPPAKLFAIGVAAGALSRRRLRMPLFRAIGSLTGVRAIALIRLDQTFAIGMTAFRKMRRVSGLFRHGGSFGQKNLNCPAASVLMDQGGNR